jgi:hypothetical protein
MQRPKAVLFDLFHTLVCVPPPSLTGERSVPEILGVSADEWQRLYYDEDVFGRCLGRVTDSVDAMRLVAHSIDPAVGEDVILEAVKSRQRRFEAGLVKVEDSVLAALAALRAAGIRTAIVSDAGADDVESWSQSPIGSRVDLTIFLLPGGLQEAGSANLSSRTRCSWCFCGRFHLRGRWRQRRACRSPSRWNAIGSGYAAVRAVVARQNGSPAGSRRLRVRRCCRVCGCFRDRSWQACATAGGFIECLVDSRSAAKGAAARDFEQTAPALATRGHPRLTKAGNRQCRLILNKSTTLRKWRFILNSSTPPETAIYFGKVTSPSPLLSKEGQARSAGVVCSKSRAAAPYRYPREARSFSSASTPCLVEEFAR